MAVLHVPMPLGGNRRKLFGRLCALALVQAGLMASGSLLVRWVFDNLLTVAPFSLTGEVLTAMGALLTIPFLGGWLRHMERVWAETLGQEYTHAVRLRLYDRLGSLAPRDLQAEESGGHLLRFIGDLTALRQWTSLGLARISAALITMTVCLGVLGYISPALGGVVALVVSVGACVAWMLGSRLRASLRHARRQRARLATDISERIAAMPVVQAFSQVRRERKRVARRSTDLKNAMLGRAHIVGILRGVTEGVTGISIAAILLVGAHEVSVGRTTLGAVVAAVSMLGIMAPALRDIGRGHEYWHAYFVAKTRIARFLASTPSVASTSKAPELPEGPGEISFESVDVEPYLHNISITAPAGAVIALVGPNGIGKSTLLALIARQLEADSGRIRIDGHDIRDHNAASIRAAIGVVSPDLPLLRGTVLRNIRYRCPQATDEEVRKICEICGVDVLAEELSGGLEARIAEGGLNLSPGQRQRIALARALIGAPRILLLDEVDSSLDPITSRLVDGLLQQFSGTVIFVSHRIERIIQADTVWHLDRGGFVEVGPPSDLLQGNGPTRQLFRLPLGHVA